MVRSHVFLVGVSMIAAVAACGSGQDQSDSVVQLSPASVDTAVPGSQPFDDVEPQVEGLTLRFGNLAERSIDRVEHEALIDVDEEGTLAAAATGGAMADSHGPTVTINQPFLYVIRDTGAGTVLFIGRVTDPSITP